MAENKELQIVISAKDEASKTLQSFSGQLKNLGSNLRDAGLLLSGIGAATGIAAKGFIDAAGKMEATKTAFNVLIGNSKLAEKTLNDLLTLEARTPFTLESILTESKKLLAMGTDAKDLTSTLTNLGDVAAGVGFEKLPQLTLAFGQIQAKGRLMGTELRQLTEAGFNLADAMGVSHEQLEQMISDGQVGFEDVRLAFEKVTSEGGRFDGMMEKLSQTTPGRISTMESGIFKLQAAFGTALLPAVNALIDALLPAMESFARFAKEHETLTMFVVGLGIALGILGITLATIGFAIPGLIAVFNLFGMTITLVGTIITGLIGILGGPLTIALAAIAALVALVTIAWKKNWLDIQGKTQDLVNFFNERVVPAFMSIFNTIKGVVSGFMNFLRDSAFPVIQNVFNNITGALKSAVSGWIDRFNAVKSAVESVIGAIRGIISAAEDLARRVARGLKVPGFQHGGFVPGAYNQAVPAILHGGERVIPRTGVDVNSGGFQGGGVGSLTLNFTGPVSMDSDIRVKELADRVINILGRQNELASKGLSI